MRNKVFLAFIICFVGNSLADDDPNWIEQWGIRWTFDKPISKDGTAGTYQYGQFVNGDYWVVGPVKIVSINPPCHVTTEGEKDESGVSYTYPSVIGSGQWTIFWGGNLWRARIKTSDTATLAIGQVVLVTDAMGTHASKVNYSSHTVKAVVANTSFDIELSSSLGVAGADTISGGRFGGILINGSVINPLVTQTTHGYTSAANGYLHSTNVAWRISTENPLTVPVNSSLISTVSRVITNDYKTFVNRAQILTVLPSDAFNKLPGGVKPEDCFRPHYFGIDAKKIVHYKTAMDESFLGNLALIAEQGQGKPTLAAMTEQFARPWVRIGTGHLSGSIHPKENMPYYYMQKATNDGARVLNSSDYTLAEKRPLLIGYVQCGIDLFGQYAEGGHGNIPDGGIMTGMMLPMLAFGKAFDYQPVWDMFAKAGSYRYSAKPGTDPVEYYSDGDLPPDYNYVQELCQTFYVTQRDVDITNNLFRNADEYLHGVPLWTPDRRTSPNLPYTADMIGTPDWGIRHSILPYASDAACPQSNYRELNSVHYPHMQLMVLVWGLKEKVNHDAWFDYTDRWAKYSSYQTNTWKAYRHLYGPIWPNTATTAETYSLTVNTKDCSVAKVSDKTTYASGEKVTLTAKPLTGFRFSEWLITANEQTTTYYTNPITITMDSNKTISAICIPNPTEGQIFHAPLDDGSGTTATDANNLQIGNLISGPLWGAEWRDEDWLGFNQSTQTITIPTMGMSHQAGTIAVWVEPTDFSGMKFIFGHVLNNANRLSLYTVAGSLAAGLGANATLKTNITPLPLGEPVHLALSWNGTAYAVYVNGVQKAAGTFGGLTALNTFIDIGNYGDPAFRSLGFAGKIDDIRTYNRTLAAEEIDALYLTQDVRQGKELKFTVNAVNAQGIPIVYQAAAMPAGASFDAATQLVRWTPWHNQLGLFSFRFTSTGQPEKVVNVEVHPSSMTSWYIGGQGQLTKVR